MAAITYFQSGDAIPEQSTAIYQTTLTPHPGTFDLLSFSAMSVTLQDATGAIINSRSAQNCLNTGNGVLASDGTFTFTFQPEDSVIASTKDYVKRIATFHIVFNGGTVNHAIDFFVRNLLGVS